MSFWAKRHLHRTQVQVRISTVISETLRLRSGWHIERNKMETQSIFRIMLPILIVPTLVTVGRRSNCACRFCLASMGAGHAWKKLEWYAAHDEGTGSDYKRALSIHQASHLYSVHSHFGFHAFYLRQLAHRPHLGRHDRSRYCLPHWLWRIAHGGIFWRSISWIYEEDWQTVAKVESLRCWWLSRASAFLARIETTI